MKLHTLVFMFFVSSSVANKLISLDNVETLFTKLMLNTITEEENQILDDTIEILQRPEFVNARSIDGASKYRTAIDCLVCRSAFGALFGSVQQGQTDEHIADSLTTLCVRLNIENYNVCRGAVRLNVPILTHIIKTTPEATPSTFCGLVLQNAGDPNVCPFNDNRFEWQVELPAKSDVTRPSENGNKPLKVAIISDAHIDPLYEAYGVAECDEPTCCRKGQKPGDSFVHRSVIDEYHYKNSLVHIHGTPMLNLTVAQNVREAKSRTRTRFAKKKNVEPAGFWGDYRDCDTPIWAFDDAIKTLHENHKDIDMIYYIGDTIDHGVWETSYDLINDMNRYLVEKIRKTFGDDVLVVPTLGNHESQPTNQFAPSSITDEKINTTWLYKALVNKWEPYLTEEAKATLLDRGDFSILVKPWLRVISLNNNVAYKYNWWLVYDPLDAKRHLDWLVEELYKSESAGEKVHILTHIPPGVHDLTHTWTREYNRIINRFTSTIAAEFNGHTHSDEFKIFYSPENIPINVAWGIGSVTTYSFYNLNYKIATFDSQTYMPENILNYVYNLTEANLTPNRRPHWFLLYDMKNSFQIPDLTAASMDKTVYSMVTDNRRLLDLYSMYYSKLSDGRWPFCNDYCKIDNLCKTVVTVLWERQKCDELRKLFFETK